MLRWLVVFVAVSVAACGARRSSGLSPGETDLCIRNETAGYGNVVARAGQVRFDVQPGREECKRINVTAGTLLQAQTTAGGATGPLSFRARLPGPHGCWLWRLDNLRAGGLFPCE